MFLVFLFQKKKVFDSEPTTSAVYYVRTGQFDDGSKFYSDLVDNFLKPLCTTVNDFWFARSEEAKINLEDLGGVKKAHVFFFIIIVLFLRILHSRKNKYM